MGAGSAGTDEGMGAAFSWLLSFVGARWGLVGETGNIASALGLGFWAVSAGFTALVLFAKHAFGVRGVIYLWIASEVAFVFVNLWRCILLGRQPDCHEPADHDAELSFAKFIQCTSKLDNGKSLSEWFFGAQLTSLRRENVEDLVAYGFCYKTRQDVINAGGGAFLTHGANEMMRLTNLSLMNGHNSEVNFRGHLWDGLKWMHFPLTVYIITEILGSLSQMALFACGFTRHTQVGVPYFLYNPKDVDNFNKRRHHQVPIFFLHGIGVGLIAYVPFICRLLRLRHPIVILESRHICMRFCTTSPSVDDTVGKMKAILENLKITKCGVVSHSYGTFVASRFLTLFPEKVEMMCMIDPVCCVMHNPKLLANFVYRRVKFTSIRDFFRSLVMWGVSKEPSISTSVMRKFAWTALNLWPENLPRKSVLVVSEGDELVPVNDVKTVFGATNATILSLPCHRHAEFLMDKQWQGVIISHIAKQLKE